MWTQVLRMNAEVLTDLVSLICQNFCCVCSRLKRSCVCCALPVKPVEDRNTKRACVGGGAWPRRLRPRHDVPGSLKRPDSRNSAAAQKSSRHKINYTVRPTKEKPEWLVCDKSILSVLEDEEKSSYFILSGWKSLERPASSPPQLWYPEVRLQRDGSSAAAENGHILLRGGLRCYLHPENFIWTFNPPFNVAPDLFLGLRRSLFNGVSWCHAPFWARLLSDHFQPLLNHWRTYTQFPTNFYPHLQCLWRLWG